MKGLLDLLLRFFDALLAFIKKRPQNETAPPVGPLTPPTVPPAEPARVPAEESRSAPAVPVPAVVKDVEPKKDTRESRFIDRLWPIALQIKNEFGIHPPILITQAAHESRWGESELTDDANNLFGMTGDDWWAQGKPVLTMKTWEESAKEPDQIRYWSRPGDIIEKKINPKGGSILTVLRPFRMYATWDESVRDWVSLLIRPRFAKALAAARSGDIKAFAKEMQAAGYATDSNYEAKLLAMAARVDEALA